METGYEMIREELKTKRWDIGDGERYVTGSRCYTGTVL